MFRPTHQLRSINRKYFFDYFLIITIALILFAWLQAAPALPEPDSFYHAKMAMILGEGRVLHQFPWLQETTLKNNFVDHHFLYHLLLIPFVKVMDPLAGVKLATVLFASLLALTIYWLFKKFQLKYPFIFILILLVTEPWLFRTSLVKAPAVFLIFLLLAFYFLAHRKWPGLFLISFFSVWLYAGWPLLLIVAAVYVLFAWLLEKMRLEDSIWFKIKKIFSVKKNTVPFRGFVYVLLGVICGLIINPYFPGNLKFYWQQIVEIFLVNMQKTIGVGGEWYPYGFLNLISDASLVCALAVVSLLLFILTYKKQSIYSWTWGVLMIAFFILTLKSRRNVEFFAPMAVIFSAFCFGDYFKKLSAFHLKMLMHLGWQALFTFLLIILSFGFIFKIPADLAKAKNDLKNGWSLSHYQQSSEWLKQHTAPGSVVFHADWDDFPFLFYYNSQNMYLTGLDPTFMYKNDKERYWQYVNITLGKEYRGLQKTIKDDFGANYVFLDKSHVNLNRLLKYHVDFEKVFEDDEALIYYVK